MNKRIKKKQNRSIVKVKGFENCIVTAYVKKKYWNKGEKGGVYYNGDYLNHDYINKRGFKYVAIIKDCKEIHFTLAKNFRNKNRIEAVKEKARL